MPAFIRGVKGRVSLNFCIISSSTENGGILSSPLRAGVSTILIAEKLRHIPFLYSAAATAAENRLNGVICEQEHKCTCSAPVCSLNLKN